MATVRAFKPDFCDLWDREVWPKLDAVKQWLRTERAHERVKATKNDDHTMMRSGGAVSDTFLRAFIQYVTRDTDPNTPDREAYRNWSVLKSYLENSCAIVDPERLSIDDILDLTCTSPSSEEVYKSNWFVDAPKIVRDLFEIFRKLRKEPWKTLKLCDKDSPTKRAQDVSDAIEWMFVILGRDFGRSNSLSLMRAIDRAEERLQTSYSDYRKRAIDWCDFERWTIVRAFDGERIVGMSMVLPLQKHCYDAIKSGDRMTYSCQREEMLHVSSHLLVEACAERTSPEGIRIDRFSRSAVPAIICQEAWLSTIAGIGTTIPLHLLAPAGTKENTRRLWWSGYRLTGTYVCNMRDVDFMERRFTIYESGIKKPFDNSLLGSWLRLQKELRSPEAQAWLDSQ